MYFSRQDKQFSALKCQALLYFTYAWEACMAWIRSSRTSLLIPSTVRGLGKAPQGVKEEASILI